MTNTMEMTLRGVLAGLMLTGPAAWAEASQAAAGLSAAGELANGALQAAAKGDLGSAWTAGGRAFESGTPTPASPVAAGEERSERSGLSRALGSSQRPSAAADIPAPQPAGAQAREGGVLQGVAKGSSEGAMYMFGLVLSPAVNLLSDAFGRDMSRVYDGPRGDNGNSGLRWAGGMALAVVLYIPALIAAGLGGIGGGIAGGVSEAASPGSTRNWCGECRLDSR